MCEQSQAVINLYKFAAIEAGVENRGREPLVGTEEVIKSMMEEYECDCNEYSSLYKIGSKAFFNPFISSL
jgi:hypothetical protein